MTREQALLDNIPDNCIWEDKLDNCPQSYVYQSMDEYAQQQSIAFAEWAFKNYHMTLNAGGGKSIWHPRYMALDGKNDVHTDELYTLFLQSQKQ